MEEESSTRFLEGQEELPADLSAGIPEELPAEIQVLKGKRKADSLVEDYNSLFPKNLLLLITTHGVICARKDIANETENFDIPESIHTLFKLNLAPAGVSANLYALQLEDISDAFKTHDAFETLKKTDKKTHLHKIIEIIKAQFLNFSDLSTTTDTRDLQTFMEKLQNDIRPLYEKAMPETHPDYVEERDTLHKAVNLHMWLERPVDAEEWNRMYNNNEFVHSESPGTKKMANKIFITGDRSEHPANPNNFGIIALNLNNGRPTDILPDILTSLKRPGRSTQHSLRLKTSEILEFLSNIKNDKGEPIIENLLILDTSCANFQFGRKLAKETTEIGYGGKISKRRRKKSKKSLRKKSKKSLRKKSKKNRSI
jgi:hypothetical protein